MIGRLLRWLADSPLAILPLALIAIVERVGWSLAGNMAYRDTELRNAAMAWASTGTIADAYHAGSGPTAHVGWLPPVIPGIVFALFGAEPPVSTLILTTISALVVVATAFVLNRAFARLRTPAPWRGAALVIACIVPMQLELEARSLRVYENGTAALALALLLLAAIRLDDRGRVGPMDVLGLSAFAALIFALSPIAGATAAVMLGILALRRMRWRGRGLAAAALAIALIGTSLPWALRNEALVGQREWTRGNFGLEFALGTHAAAVAPADPSEIYLARIAEIHPHDNARGYAAMAAAGGEIPYARKLGAETWAWVRAHPTGAMCIWARHLFEFFFPPPWLWLHTASPDATMPARIVAVDIIAALALFGLAAALARRDWRMLYILPPVVLLPLPYLLTQPLIRYRYAIATLLVFLAADALGLLTKRGPVPLGSAA